MAESQPISALPVGTMQLGESPFWHPGEQALYWCDITGKKVHRYRPAETQRRRRLRSWGFISEPASCAPILGGGLLVATRGGLHRLNTDEGPHAAKPRLVIAPYDEREARWNDGKADPWGRFWVGMLTENRSLTGGLYRYAGGELVEVFGGVANSNGLAWSADGTLMFWTHTAESTIYVFDYDGNTGELSNKRVLISFPKKAPGQDLAAYYGRPDGTTVDETGRLVVAMYEGAKLVVIDPGDASENAGTVVDEIHLPVQCPTMAAFGGPDLSTLYITTASAGRPADELARQPMAGQVLVTEMEVPGLTANYVLLGQ